MRRSPSSCVRLCASVYGVRPFSLSRTPLSTVGCRGPGDASACIVLPELGIRQEDGSRKFWVALPKRVSLLVSPENSAAIDRGTGGAAPTSGSPGWP
eukprot:6912565-Prymnesium_polylepis.1